jgi:hypothetical protein
MQYVDDMDEADKKKLLGEVSAIVGDPTRLAETCAQIRVLGAPTYHPTYMIQHGMGAFLGGTGKNGLVEWFHGAIGWEEALSEYLHCPEAKK